MNGVPHEVFKKYDPDGKLDTLFFYISEIHATSVQADKDLQDRVKKLEDRKKFDTAIGGISGFFGGAITFIGSKFFLK